MRIRSEQHCARLHRRVTFPLHLSTGGQMFAVINWSVGGILVDAGNHVLRLGRVENGELLIPCTDGVFSLSVRFQPVRHAAQGCGCQFVDLPLREQAILHYYVDAVTEGRPTSMEELDEAGQNGRATLLAPAPASTPPSEPSEPATTAVPPSLARRRRVMIGVMGLILALIGFFVLPYVGGSIMKKFTRPGEYLKVAESRVEAAQLNIRDLDRKIASLNELMAGNQGMGTLHAEQVRILELGLGQLQTERDMAAVHLRVLEANRDLIEKGDFLIEETIFSGYNTDSRLSPAPYLTEVLTDLAAGRRMEPRTVEDREKFSLIAQARLEQAQHSLEAVRIRQASLAAIVERAEKAGIASALPLNKLDEMRRDQALYGVEEKRIESLIALLQENVAAVASGNFIYETQLLQRFDPRPLMEMSRTDVSTVQQ